MFFDSVRRYLSPNFCEFVGNFPESSKISISREIFDEFPSTFERYQNKFFWWFRPPKVFFEFISLEIPTIFPSHQNETWQLLRHNNKSISKLIFSKIWVHVMFFDSVDRDLPLNFLWIFWTLSRKLKISTISWNYWHLFKHLRRISKQILLMISTSRSVFRVHFLENS